MFTLTILSSNRFSIDILWIQHKWC